jgi:hypothetical protein
LRPQVSAERTLIETGDLVEPGLIEPLRRMGLL